MIDDKFWNEKSNVKGIRVKGSASSTVNSSPIGSDFNEPVTESTIKVPSAVPIISASNPNIKSDFLNLVIKTILLPT